MEDILNSDLLDSVPHLHEHDSFEELLGSAGTRVPSELMVSATSSLLHSDFFSSDEDEDNGTERGHAEYTSNLQLDELIGRGAFGSVYKATWRGQPAAVKVCPAPDHIHQPAHGP